MALLTHPAFRHPALARIRTAFRSRAVLGVGYGIAATLTGVAILLAASPPEKGPLGPASELILAVLGFNLILIIALMIAVALRIFELLDARSRDAGARLHVRFVRLFALAAVAPAAVVFLFYGVLVTQGVENWFSARVQTVVENSATVFRSYIEEQTRETANRVTAMALDLNREAPSLQGQPARLTAALQALASYHEIPALYLVNKQGQVIARAEATGAPAFEPLPASAYESADQGEIYVHADDVIRALYRLPDYNNVYVYAARPLETGIVAHLREAESSLVSYREVKENRGRIQTIFTLSYAETALLVLVGAVWLGLAAANAISAPVARLVQAAGRVAGGDLSARVDADADPDEIAVLSRAFNSMTHDLQAQQEALRRAGEEAEERRQFIETVLTEVSAGVIGLSPDGLISVANRQAAVLLALPGDQGRGRKLSEVVPEFAELAAAGRSGEAEEEIDVVRGRDNRRLRVRASQSEGGLVLTFDDVTRLVAAQRNAAWRDVARRIAHEIKNPLTPIQLSAERLRRKYRKDIAESELETFDRCTDTIIRQVGDIGRMVDEFSSFARMPAPKFAKLEAGELVRAAVFAQRVASPDFTVELEEMSADATLYADGRMIGQALTNVLKNAAEAVEARRAKSPNPKGRITARLIVEDASVAIEIEDNGIGLPAKDRDRLTEPYVTTREKGTGLGLAIVKRILEDHGGELELADARRGQGALAILRLPAAPAPRTAKPTAVATAK
ncbi:MAG: PAS domain-containing sensor histidine kinase [Alphaproteobacteria bacterium]|nr:PAS domain-containing sensor histidine kinase [Alphaproteobacteria bacterium]MBU1513736.1 PAS domain-containing sensor histidine kinase [Alphaproteobacteria bacterium]MBU2094619.1 PAS domain-containing sensor histidine kinase [Alphaproteobacteria bacterium]MBU2150312.1 PAS domain-containing sensor histidine kinase [Alphaproteobacteria bacterium]MBU2309159.1 PAS domain-containing sensor histidine kinase [Alphaproteobacteria bacterium]